MARRAFLFIGNSLALDFVNTELREAAARIELLRSDADLLAWARQAGLGAPGAAPAGLDPRARPLRAALRALFEARLDGRPPPRRALDTVNAVLRHPARPAPLVRRGLGYARPPAALTPAAVLRRVAEEAAAFLTTADPRLLRRCAASGCILLFHDTSRTHRRRWCSMSVCGNRAKVGRYRRRSDARTA